MDRQILEDVVVQGFLERYYEKKVTNLKRLSGGKHSQAFSYSHDNLDYVLRLNEGSRGFKKDKYAYQNFSGKGVPIPEIYDFGPFDDSTYYCISKKLPGETVRQQYVREDFSSFFLQFEVIEKIKDIKIPAEYVGFGEWETEDTQLFASFRDYIQGIYTTNSLVDWEKLKELPYFDHNFTEYLFKKVDYYSQYSTDMRELLHGDFGNDNCIVENSIISGVIDWERSLYGDHFLDVGRVILFCPDRQTAVRAALNYYSNTSEPHYQERIMMGVYFAMLRNYGLAARDGNEASCINSPRRIQEFEELMVL